MSGGAFDGLGPVPTEKAAREAYYKTAARFEIQTNAKFWSKIVLMAIELYKTEDLCLIILRKNPMDQASSAAVTCVPISEALSDPALHEYHKENLRTPRPADEAPGIWCVYHSPDMDYSMRLALRDVSDLDADTRMKIHREEITRPLRELTGSKPS